MPISIDQALVIGAALVVALMGCARASCSDSTALVRLALDVWSGWTMLDGHCGRMPMIVRHNRAV